MAATILCGVVLVVVVVFTSSQAFYLVRDNYKSPRPGHHYGMFDFSTGLPVLIIYLLWWLLPFYFGSVIKDLVNSLEYLRMKISLCWLVLDYKNTFLSADLQKF